MNGQIIETFVRWMDAVEPALLPSEPLKAAIRYYENHGDALFRFVDDPIVPIDNSRSVGEFSMGTMGTMGTMGSSTKRKSASPWFL